MCASQVTSRALISTPVSIILVVLAIQHGLHVGGGHGTRRIGRRRRLISRLVTAILIGLLPLLSAAELQLIANLMDPNFVGSEPPVQSIAVQGTLLSTVQETASRYRQVHDWSVTVINGSASGFMVDARLEFVIIAQSGGPGWIVQEIREVLSLEPGQDGPVEGRPVPLSWGLVKALYR